MFYQTTVTYYSKLMFLSLLDGFTVNFVDTSSNMVFMLGLKSLILVLSMMFIANHIKSYFGLWYPCQIHPCYHCLNIKWHNFLYVFQSNSLARLLYCVLFSTLIFLKPILRLSSPPPVSAARLSTLAIFPLHILMNVLQRCHLWNPDNQTCENSVY